MAVSGFLVEAERVADREMEDWMRRYPDAFGRKTDAGCGVCLGGWMIGSGGGVHV
jgi:hypothetical protein